MEHRNPTFLTNLVGVTSALEFMTKSYGTRLQLFRATQGKDTIPNEDDIFELLYSTEFPTTNVDLADGQEALPKSSYCIDNRVDINKVMQLHASGATIILRAAHRWSSKLAIACDMIEYDFGYRTQANVYLTPAGKKSTPPHWDTHDLFIYQISGKKRWDLFECTYHYPLTDQRFSADIFPVVGPTTSLTLACGDVLYLPRGCVHEPKAEEFSIHVSFGLHIGRKVELLQCLVDQVARQRTVLRNEVRLPVGLASDVTVDNLASEISELLHLLDDATLWRAAASDFVGRKIKTHSPSQTASSVPRTQGQRYQLAPFTYVYSQLQDEGVRLIWKGGDLVWGNSESGLVGKILSGKAFCVEELVDDPVLRPAFDRLCQDLCLSGLLVGIG